MAGSVSDDEYLALLLDAVRVCRNYRPKLGQGGGGLEVEEFTALYGSDPFYSWIGLDSPLMYAAHKAAGGMTSIYRQIGIGCERLFRAVLRNTCSLSEQEATWSYSTPSAGGGSRTLTLDARVDLRHVESGAKQERLEDWLRGFRQKLDVQTDIQGAVFEVRQGYKSKDSKRQNADLANAATAYTQGYLPVLVVMSLQLDFDIRVRYEQGKWGVLAGDVQTNDPHFSTFAFCSNVLGYDLAGLFERNTDLLRSEIIDTIEYLLEPA